LISYCRTIKMRYRIFRLANVYGPNDEGKGKKKNALQYLIDEIKQNHDINLYHDGDFIRDYIHVDDACRAMKLCMDQAPFNQIINIGSGYPYQFRSLIDFVAKHTNYTGTIHSIQPTEFHDIVQVKDFYTDNTKLLELGFKQKIRMDEGLKELL
jgi:dTDP-glucose 4,6-dehydratase